MIELEHCRESLRDALRRFVIAHRMPRTHAEDRSIALLRARAAVTTASRAVAHVEARAAITRRRAP